MYDPLSTDFVDLMEVFALDSIEFTNVEPKPGEITLALSVSSDYLNWVDLSEVTAMRFAWAGPGVWTIVFALADSELALKISDSDGLKSVVEIADAAER